MKEEYKLIEVKDKRSEKRFLKMPRFIYRDDKNWIPHLKQDLQKKFDPKENKLLVDGKAARWVINDAQGQTVGRIAAFINAKTAYLEEEPVGGIGFFESINDTKVSTLLFDTARDWLKSNGMTAMDGPINLGDRNQFWGLLIQNFTSPNAYAMNYNPEYYRELFESYGFKTYFEQYVYHRKVRQPVEAVFVRKYNALLARYNVHMEDVQGKSIEKIASDFRAVYNGAWVGYHNFKEISEDAALKIAKALKPIMDRRIIVFAYDGEKPIGFYVNIPELNEIFRYVNGNLNWIGKLKFLYHKWRKTPRTMVGVIFGVVKEWQGKGVEGAMIMWMGLERVPHMKYEDTILTWIADFNPRMMKVATNLGTDLHRTYITYRYLFDREKKFERYPIMD